MAAVAASIIVGAVASYAAQEVIKSVGETLGLHENDISNLALVGGIWAGAAAGGATYEGMTTPATDPSVMQDLGPGVDTSISGGPSVNMPVSETGSQVNIGSQDALGLGADVAAPTPITTTPPVDSTPFDTSLADAPAAVTPPVSTPEPWYESMWNSERTGDVVVGAASGIATGAMQADAIEEQRRAEERQRARYNAAWATADPSMFPSIRRPEVSHVAAPSVNAPAAPTVSRAGGMLSRQFNT